MTGQKLGIIRGAERNLRGFAILTDTSESLMGKSFGLRVGEVCSHKKEWCVQSGGGWEGEECVRMGHD